MYYLISRDGEPLTIAEGDTEEEAGELLLRTDDRVTATDLLTFDFTPLAVRTRPIEDYDSCTAILRDITVQITQVTDHMRLYESSEMTKMTRHTQEVIYAKKQIMDGIAMLHDVLNRQG